MGGVPVNSDPLWVRPPDALADVPHEELVRRILRDLDAEDTRMRSEVLPTPPEGWAWVLEVQSTEDIVRGEVAFRLHYTMNPTYNLAE